MVLALAPHNSNFSIDNYEALPRVVAKYYRKSQQTCVICDAFRTNKFEFLEKLYGIIPEVFETADMKNDMQDEILYATEKGNRDKVIWAIDHGWMRAERVVRMVARYGYNDLAAELRWKYNVPV
jgi:hypothetical protein